MNTTEAIEVLTKHNKWRRGDDDIEPTDPKQLGIAIERAIAVMEAANTFAAASDGYHLPMEFDGLFDALEEKP
jgi:hypothetical protein